MNAKEFKEKVANVEGPCKEEQLDELCLQWLSNALESNGREGKLGLKLLRIIAEECML